MKNVAINLSINSYNVIVGNNISNDFSDFTKFFANKKVIFIIDKNIVLDSCVKYKEKISQIAHETHTIISPFDGEHNKTYQAFEYFCEAILELHPNRKNTVVVIIGGGAIGDAVHFVASSVLRGLDTIRIPTTLLSMVDSSVGGKVAINSHKIKNMVGCFSQPKLVICDIAFLLTLNKRELMSGYAELLKHALIFDEELFNKLEKNINVWKSNLADYSDWLVEIIARSVEIKYHFIKNDEFDLNGIRAIVNFGHTVGHAIEKAKQLNYLHGEAIAMGMYIEAKIAEDLELLEKIVPQKIKEHLQKTNLWNLDFLIVQPEYLMQLMSDDKKIELDNAIKISDFYCKEKLPIVCLTKIGSAQLKIDIDYKIVLKNLIF